MADPVRDYAGCGFPDTVARLLAAGAAVDARDVTQCTPLQNAAHGTYSALAQPCAGAAAPDKKAGGRVADLAGAARLSRGSQLHITYSSSSLLEGTRHCLAICTCGRHMGEDADRPATMGLQALPEV